MNCDMMSRFQGILSEEKRKMTNQSLRERFRLSEKKAESVSRAIRDAVDAGKIKLADSEQTSMR